MRNLALAVRKRSNFMVTGSDDHIPEPSYSRLKENNLLPAELGWFPEKIHKGLHAVISGVNTAPDNPELLRAKELGLKIYTMPEYLYHLTRSKTRIVVAGSHGKTTVVAMILFVLNRLRMDVDYIAGVEDAGLEHWSKLSYESRIAVFEGDECLISAIDTRPKFHLYKPHVAVLTGIAWDHIRVFPTVENYIGQFKTFIDLMEVQGRLIYFDGDENLNEMMLGLRRDIVPFGYNTPEHEIIDGVTYLDTRKGNIPLKIFGDHNLQNLTAARLACRQIGVTDIQFFEIIAEFPGVVNRLQKIAQTQGTQVFRDSAHSPSGVRASIGALKQQFPGQKVVACYELHTFSSLSGTFLPQYAHSMDKADLAFVYYNPETVKGLGLNVLDPEEVRKAFGHDNLVVAGDKLALMEKLGKVDYGNSSLLFMTSAGFSGMDLPAFANQLLKNEV